MTDPDRGQPQYGEYATPEEQRAAIREPAPGGAPVVAGAPAAPTRRDAPADPHRPAHAHGGSAGHPLSRPTTTAARPPRRADRIITLLLLVYGLITVASAIPQLWHFAEFADAWMTLAGIDGTFTNIAQGELWGRIGVAVFVIGWLVTAGLSGLALSRGRLGWWIPMVGAIVSFIVVSVCLTVPLLGDPAIMAHFGA